MQTKVSLREQKVSDAQQFFDILNNPNFKYFQVCPKDLKAERKIIKQGIKKRRKKLEYKYAILFDGKLVEGCGITVHPKRTFIGEIGYFIDERFWGRGIATQAVKILEKTGFQELGLERIEILMDPQNIASEKVVVKCSYSKEGTMKKGIKNRNYFSDAHLYAKVKDSYTADN